MSLGTTQHPEGLKAHVQAQRERYIDVMRDLLAKSAEGEDALQQAVAQYLSQLGCQVESIASKPNRFVLSDDFAPSQSSDDAERMSIVGMKARDGNGVVCWSLHILIANPYRIPNHGNMIPLQEKSTMVACTAGALPTTSVALWLLFARWMPFKPLD